MAKNSKEVKKSTKTAINEKGKLTNLKGAKTVSKKAVAKKIATKKKAAPKKVVSKTKPASTRKLVEPLIKKANPVKTIMKKPAVVAKRVQEATPVVTNLPPVEEKSPEIIPVINNSAPGIDIKSIQKEALRHFDNHHIHLSIKKGGIKPSGKKPLW